VNCKHAYGSNVIYGILLSYELGRVPLHAFSRLSLEMERENPILAVIETTDRKWAEYEDY